MMNDISDLIKKEETQKFRKSWKSKLAEYALCGAAYLFSLAGCGGKSGSGPIDDSFGDNETDAIGYIESILTEHGYTSERNVNAEFLNPDNSQYFDNNYDVRGELSSDEIYIEYRSTADGLTHEAEDGINARTSYGFPPPLVIIEPADSQAVIRDKIETALGIVGASAPYKAVQEQEADYVF